MKSMLMGPIILFLAILTIPSSIHGEQCHDQIEELTKEMLSMKKRTEMLEEKVVKMEEKEEEMNMKIEKLESYTQKKEKVEEEMIVKIEILESNIVNITSDYNIMSDKMKNLEKKMEETTALKIKDEDTNRAKREADNEYDGYDYEAYNGSNYPGYGPPGPTTTPRPLPNEALFKPYLFICSYKSEITYRGTGYTGTIVYSKVLHEAGTQGEMDLASGVFTSFRSGHYRISVSGYAIFKAEQSVDVFIMVNGRQREDSQWHSSYSSNYFKTSPNGYVSDQGSREIFVHLAAWDTVQVNCDRYQGTLHKIQFCVQALAFDSNSTITAL